MGRSQTAGKSSGVEEQEWSGVLSGLSIVQSDADLVRESNDFQHMRELRVEVMADIPGDLVPL